MQRILFISAPFGPFFRSAANELQAQGHSVWRIVWDGGDLIETPWPLQVRFRGKRAEWRSFILKTIEEKGITTVVTYNDTSPRNRIANDLAQRLGLNWHVLENGYLRPHWITFDREGVNGYSALPRSAKFYPQSFYNAGEEEQFPVRMRDHVRSAVAHFAASCLLHPLFPIDSRYYGDPIFKQAKGYTREYFWRKTHRERRAASAILRKKADGGKIYAVLLQKPGDAQLRVHSHYRSNTPFLREVVASFAAHASKDAVLVIKQHPFDYGIEKLPERFAQIAADAGISDRVFYLRKTSIDIILDRCDGLVTINSTGGLMAAMRNLPVLCCGHAIFDIEGLTFQGGLDRFWAEGAMPDRKVLNAFVTYLKRYSQLNGGFHHPKGIALAAKGLARVISANAFAPHHVLASEARRDAKRKPENALPFPMVQRH